jgi:hypothetical protein
MPRDISLGLIQGVVGGTQNLKETRGNDINFAKNG